MVVVLPPRCMLKRNVCLLQVHCQVVSQCVCFYYLCLLYHTIISFVQEYIIPVYALYTEGVCVQCKCAIGVFALLHTCKKPLQSTCYAICLSVWLNRHHHKCATGFSVSLSVWKALQQTKRTNSQTVPTTAHSILLTLILCVCVCVCLSRAASSSYIELANIPRVLILIGIGLAFYSLPRFSNDRKINRKTWTSRVWESETSLLNDTYSPHIPHTHTQICWHRRRNQSIPLFASSNTILSKFIGATSYDDVIANDSNEWICTYVHMIFIAECAICALAVAVTLTLFACHGLSFTSSTLWYVRHIHRRQYKIECSRKCNGFFQCHSQFL